MEAKPLAVNVLGTEYSVEIKAYAEDEAFERSSLSGYCDGWAKKIVVCDMATYKGWEKEPKETCAILQKASLRHEVVHAFLNESGLSDNSFIFDGAWAKNEEMVDWFALQGPKIYEAWQSVGAV